MEHHLEKGKKISILWFNILLPVKMWLYAHCQEFQKILKPIPEVP